MLRNHVIVFYCWVANENKIFPFPFPNHIHWKTFFPKELPQIDGCLDRDDRLSHLRYLLSSTWSIIGTLSHHLLTGKTNGMYIPSRPDSCAKYVHGISGHIKRTRFQTTKSWTSTRLLQITRDCHQFRPRFGPLLSKSGDNLVWKYREKERNRKERELNPYAVGGHFIYNEGFLICI